MTTEKQEKENSMALPKQSAGDVLHTVARALVSAVPFVGSPAEKFFTLWVAPPLHKKMNAWMEYITSSVEKLQQKYEEFKIEDLVNNELFQATLLHSTTVAVRNYQEEKKEALRNAVLNTALRTSSDDDLELMFVAFIDLFTPRHIKILRFFDDPKKWAQENRITYPAWSFAAPADALEHAFPECSKELYEAIVKDLTDRGLMRGNIHVGTRAGILAGRTTPMGKKFLAFISSPI